MEQYAEQFDPISYINTPRWSYSSLGLERIQLLLSKLGDPQNDFSVVHVAGTNGKGSTCAYIDSILRAAGLKVALFTSPYIERFEERIRVDGRNISSEDLLEVTLAVRDAAAEVETEFGEHPTEFELMAAVAFLHFARAGVDVAVVEVGLGGALDATNVFNPALCVIARIGLDHTDILGDTLALIATEKAGIIKPGVPVVSWPQEPEAMEVIRARCSALDCPLVRADFSALKVEPLDPLSIKRRFIYKDQTYETNLIAAYQPYNAAVAIEAIQHLVLPGISSDRLLQALPGGIASTVWPGRFEIVFQDPLIVVDGSHNPQGAETLAETMQELEDVLVSRALKTEPSLDEGELPDLYVEDRAYEERHPVIQEISARPSFACKQHTLVMGVLADKEYPSIIAPLAPFARRFVVYTPPNPRALAACDLAAAIHEQVPEMEVIVCETPDEAVAIACDLAEPNSMVLAFGTLYAIGAIKQAIRRILG